MYIHPSSLHLSIELTISSQAGAVKNEPESHPPCSRRPRRKCRQRCVRFKSLYALLLTYYPGMRKSSQILIHINVGKALCNGIKFYLSSNGVILTPGNESGLLETQFIKRVEIAVVNRRPLPRWEGDEVNKYSRIEIATVKRDCSRPQEESTRIKLNRERYTVVT
jgi:hypothetical protein